MGKIFALGIFFICFVVAYVDAFAHIIPKWLDTRSFYSHSIILVGLVCSLLWRDRNRLLRSRPPASTMILVALAASSLLGILAWASSIYIVQILAMFFVLLFGISAILGRNSLGEIILPLSLLLYTLPIWQPVHSILQDIATYAVQILLNTIGIPVFVEENFVTIPNGIFEIKGGCSGLGFLLVSLSLAQYVALSERLAVAKYIPLMFLAAGLALIANWIRIFLIILVGYYWGMDHSLVKDHITFGWVVYALLFFPFLFLSLKFLPKLEHEKNTQSHALGKIRFVRLFGILALVLVFPTIRSSLEYTANKRTPAPVILDAKSGPYIKTQMNNSSWKPEFPKANHSESLTFIHRNTDEMLHTFTASYFSQRDGTEVISYLNNLHGQHFRITNKTERIRSYENAPTAITELTLLNSNGESLTVWYWYRIGESYSASEIQAKYEQMWQTLFGRSDASVTAIAAACSLDDCSIARQSIANLLIYL